MKYVFLFLFITAAHSLKRLLTTDKAPGCPKCNYMVYYTKAEGPKDVLHYVWDFTSKPSIFMALTAPNVNVSFDWEKFALGNKYFKFSSAPEYTFALVLNKFIQFNDVEDTGILTSNSQNISYETENFAWEPVQSLNRNTNENLVCLNIRSSRYTDNLITLNGTVSIELAAFGDDGHDSMQPRLIHSANSTQCRIEFDKLHSNADFNSSRFAIELIVVSSEDNNSSSKIVSRMNFDDENSPGVFSVVDLMTPQSQNKLYKGVFLQWRPVAFTDKIPSLVNSTEVLTYNLTDVKSPEDELRNTLVYKFYGDELSDRLIQQTIVSLGMAEDGYYRKNNYSSWTFTLNYGSPETEKFSLLVIMVMAIGLGFPVVLILIGGSYMFARRLRNKHELTLTRTGEDLFKLSIYLSV